MALTKNSIVSWSKGKISGAYLRKVCVTERITKTLKAQHKKLIIQAQDTNPRSESLRLKYHAHQPTVRCQHYFGDASTTAGLTPKFVKRRSTPVAWTPAAEWA